MSTYSAIKDAIEIAKKLNQMELLEQLLDVKEQLSELREDNLTKGEQIKQLSEQLALKASIEFDKGVYWIRSDPQTPENGDTPICPRCYDSENKVIRLSIVRHSKGPAVRCSNCKQTHWIR